MSLKWFVIEIVLKINCQKVVSDQILFNLFWKRKHSEECFLTAKQFLSIFWRRKIADKIWFYKNQTFIVPFYSSSWWAKNHRLDKHFILKILLTKLFFTEFFFSEQNNTWNFWKRILAKRVRWKISQTIVLHFWKSSRKTKNQGFNKFFTLKNSTDKNCFSNKLFLKQRNIQKIFSWQTIFWVFWKRIMANRLRL